MAKKKAESLVTHIGQMKRIILSVRGQRVMLDTVLARIYVVTTKRLNEQVNRNTDRFPPDFMFQLTEKEKMEVVSNCDHLRDLKCSSHLPYAFTEHGAIMAVNVLKTKRAIQMSVFVVRAFVRLREIVLTHRELTEKLKELERKVGKHDYEIKAVIEAIRQLMQPPPKPKCEIGFRDKKLNRRYGIK